MKCPKCGYNSFEYHDVCSKCSNDLSGYKQTYGIASIVYPAEVRQQMAEKLMASMAPMGDEPGESTDSHEDMFSFDIPEDSGGSESAASDDPFNFDDGPLAAPAAPGGAAPGGDDAFADLLESNTQGGDDPFADIMAPPAAPAAPAAPAQPATGSNEFDLENFSWDDTPVAAGGAPSEPNDDFDSLFGDLEEKK